MIKEIIELVNRTVDEKVRIKKELELLRQIGNRLVQNIVSTKEAQSPSVDSHSVTPYAVKKLAAIEVPYYDKSKTIKEVTSSISRPSSPLSTQAKSTGALVNKSFKASTPLLTTIQKNNFWKNMEKGRTSLLANLGEIDEQVTDYKQIKLECSSAIKKIIARSGVTINEDIIMNLFKNLVGSQSKIDYGNIYTHLLKPLFNKCPENKITDRNVALIMQEVDFTLLPKLLKEHKNVSLQEFSVITILNHMDARYLKEKNLEGLINSMTHKSFSEIANEAEDGEVEEFITTLVTHGVCSAAWIKANLLDPVIEEEMLDNHIAFIKSLSPQIAALYGEEDAETGGARYDSALGASSPNLRRSTSAQSTIPDGSDTEVETDGEEDEEGGSTNLQKSAMPKLQRSSDRKRLADISEEDPQEHVKRTCKSEEENTHVPIHQKLIGEFLTCIGASSSCDPEGSAYITIIGKSEEADSII